MEKIILMNTVLLLSEGSAAEEHRTVIDDLLRYRKCLSLTEGIIKVADINEEDDIAITGTDAACLYCRINRITPRTVDIICFMDIAAKCNDPEVLRDILTILIEVNKCNEELYRMMNSDTPGYIIRRQKCRLQDLVEHLSANCQCNKPFTDEHGRQLSSLSCIDYEL